MAGTVVADTLQAASTSTLVLKNGVANTPPTVQDSAGTQIGTFCRAWVNFNGTLSTPITPRASFNVSSVTKAGTGNYTISFTVNMPDANFCTQTTVGGASTTQVVGLASDGTSYPAQGTTNVQVVFRTVTNPWPTVDPANVNVAVFR